MKKRFLAGLLALVMIFSVLPFSALAAEEEVQDAALPEEQNAELLGHGGGGGDHGGGDAGNDPSKTTSLTFVIEGGKWKDSVANYGGVLSENNTKLTFTLIYNSYVQGYVYTCADNANGQKTAEDFIEAIFSNMSALYTADDGYCAPGTWSVNEKGGTVREGEYLYPGDPEAQMRHVTQNPHKYDDKNAAASNEKYGFAENTVYTYTLMRCSYKVTYRPGAHGVLEGADENGNVVHSNLSLGTATPAAPKVDADTGYVFTNWDPKRAATVSGDAVYTAQYAPRNDLGYVVKYLDKETGEPVANEKSVQNQTYGDTVKEYAITVEGYVLDDDAEKTLTIGVQASQNVIVFYYSVDNWDDPDDETTGGDGIPDKYQALVTYKVEGGTWDGTDSTDKIAIFTLKEKNAETGEWTDITPAPTLEGTIPNTDNAKPDAEHKTPAYWSPVPRNTTVVKNGAVYIYKFTAKGNPLTFTFDANGGAWTEAVAGYTMGTGNTTASFELYMGDKIEQIGTEPVREGYTFDGWYHKDNDGNLTAKWWNGLDGDHYIYADDTVYAKWEKIEEPPVEQDKTGTLLINLQDENGTALGDLVTIEITREYLISETENENADYVIPASVTVGTDRYIFEKVAYGNLTGTVTRDGQIFVVGLQYTKDNWDDPDDETTGGDGIPDKYQVLVYYKSESEIKGTVKPTMEVITLDPLPAGGYRTEGDITISGAEATPKTGWLFDEWTVAPEMAFTGADAAVLKQQNLKDVSGGSVITFTAWFTGENAVLDITKTLDNKNKTYVEVGDTLEYTIRIKNTGNVDLKNVHVYDVLRDEDGKKVEHLDLYRKDTVGDKIVYTKVTHIDLKAGEVIFLYTSYKVKAEDLGKRLTNYVYATDPNNNELGEDKSETVKVVWGLFLPVLNTTDHVAYVIGYDDGTVRPNNNITRAEVATIFFRLLTDESRDFYWSKTNDYSDVSADAWYNNAVSTMSNAGIITGYPDGTFRPNAPITRAEFAAIAARFSDWVASDRSKFSDVSTSHWASKYIALAEALGWINGYPDGTFRPDRSITRAESMTLINRVLERAVENEYYMLPNMVTWSDNHPSDWFYEDVQEATNTHTYHRARTLVPGKTFYYEIWDTIEKNPDWAALEKTWSKSSSK